MPKTQHASIERRELTGLHRAARMSLLDHVTSEEMEAGRLVLVVCMDDREADEVVAFLRGQRGGSERAERGAGKIVRGFDYRLPLASRQQWFAEQLALGMELMVIASSGLHQDHTLTGFSTLVIFDYPIIAPAFRNRLVLKLRHGTVQVPLRLYTINPMDTEQLLVMALEQENRDHKQYLLWRIAESLALQLEDRWEEGGAPPAGVSP